MTGRRVPGLVAALLAVAIPALAQTGEGRFVFTRFDLEGQLPSERVTSVVRDDAGFVWLGTRDGIVRFDGVRTRTWQHQSGSSGGLPSSLIGALHVDRRGTLWAGTSRGLARFDLATASFIRFAEEALRDAGGQVITNLASDAGGLWVATRDAGYRVRYDGSVERVPSAISVQLSSPREGEVWALAERCRLRDAPVRCEDVRGEGEGPASLISIWGEGNRTVGVENSGVVWELLPILRRVGRWPGLASIPSANEAIYSPPFLWISTVDGLHVYDVERDRLSRMGVREGILSRDISRLADDPTGGIWIGSDRGFYFWSRTDPAFSPVTPADGLPDPRVNGMTRVGDRVYIGTNGGLFERRASGTWRSFFAGDQAYVNGVWQVVPAREGGLWVGGKAFGLRRLWPETGRWEAVPGAGRALGAPDGRTPVRAVLEHGGQLWVGSSSGLAVRQPDGTWRGFRRGEGGGDGLPATAINRIYADRKGRIWIGSDAGLAEFTSGQFSLAGPASLGRPVVWDIAESPADPGALWLGTVGSGACRLDTEGAHVRCFTVADGLPSNVVNRIEAGDDMLWLGTDRGLARLDPKTADLSLFTRSDGLHGNVIDLMASHQDSTGQIYVGGPGGYTTFDPRLVGERMTPPRPRFTSLSAGNHSRFASASQDTLRLPPDARRFAASFATLDYTAPGRYRYRYRLLPIETEWTDATAQSAEARYSALPPGTYTFEVQGSGRTGVFAPEAARLVVQVPPRWWERPSVRVVVGLLLLGVVGLAIRVAFRRSERKRYEAAEVSRRLATAREAERLRLARDLHDGAMQHLYRTGYDLDRLAEQADPGSVAAVRTGLDEATDELRSVLTDIRPPHLGTLGVGAALEATAQSFRRTHPGVRLALDLHATGRKWALPVQIATFRIAQEALSNAGRHARAEHVWIRLDERDGHAIVEVRDDGCGFDTSTSDVDHVRASHFGLAGLRERAEGLGGTLVLFSTPGSGTRVHARIPLTTAPKNDRFRTKR